MKRGKKNVLVSILVNNFNNEKYLNKCINSCIKQTYKNIEIIIFDDKSTDSSKNILKKYKNNKIKIIFNKKKKFNSGPLNQLNSIYISLKQSKGKYIFLLDGDDYFLKNKISQSIKTFNLNPKIVFLQDNPIYNYDNKNILPKKIKPKRKIFVNHTWPFFSPTSTMAFKRDFLVKLLAKITFSKSLFDQMFFDARAFIYIYFFEKNYIVSDKYLTIYNQNLKGDTLKNYQKKNKKWWVRRLQYHYYVDSIFKRNKKTHFKFIDYYITLLINLILKI